MAILFCLGLLAYYAMFLRRRSAATNELPRLLWMAYFALGCSAMVIAFTGVLEGTFDPNYPAILFLLLCITIGISGFLGFRSEDVSGVVATIRGQELIEGALLALQGFSIVFFLPFAFSSLSGDTNLNRLELSNTVEVLGSYGLINTIAGMGSQLFAISLVLACIRLSQPRGGGYSLLRALLLVFGSLSYVIYILAYVGRDGSVYWLMTALLVFLLFRPQLPPNIQRRIVVAGAILCGLVLVPIVTITVARFSDSDFGVGGSLFEYFGAQIHHFSDYSSIHRPTTHGLMNFPLFSEWYCSTIGGSGCDSWEDMKPYIFSQYLAQGKEPWLFGTYVSDFVADFGYVGAFVVLSIFAFMCHRVCVGRNAQGYMSVSRLLLLVFFFLVPYWGVFYFRFGIGNSFIVANLLFIGAVWIVQYLYTGREARRLSADSLNGNLQDGGQGVRP